MKCKHIIILAVLLALLIGVIYHQVDTRTSLETFCKSQGYDGTDNIYLSKGIFDCYKIDSQGFWSDSNFYGVDYALEHEGVTE